MRYIFFALILFFLFSCSEKKNGTEFFLDSEKNSKSKIQPILDESLPKWAELLILEKKINFDTLYMKDKKISFLKIDINGDGNQEIALLDKQKGLVLLFNDKNILFLNNLKDNTGFGYCWGELISNQNNGWAISNWKVKDKTELSNYFKEIEVKEKVKGQVIDLIYHDEGTVSIYYDGNKYKINFYD